MPEMRSRACIASVIRSAYGRSASRQKLRTRSASSSLTRVKNTAAAGALSRTASNARSRAAVVLILRWRTMVKSRLGNWVIAARAIRAAVSPVESAMMWISSGSADMVHTL